MHHAIGNHCLSVDRQHLRQRLGIPESYYTVQLASAWRLIVLDTTEMSGHSNLPLVGLSALSLPLLPLIDACSGASKQSLSVAVLDSLDRTIEQEGAGLQMSTKLML